MRPKTFQTFHVNPRQKDYKVVGISLSSIVNKSPKDDSANKPDKLGSEINYKYLVMRSP